MSVGSPTLLLVAILAACAAIALLWPRRRLALLLASAIFCTMAAAADVSVFVQRPPRVAVLVDASPSTRGMWFRDAAEARRIAAPIVPGATLRFLTFADGEPAAMTGAIEESPTTRSVLPTVDADADAVILMSDGQLDTWRISAAVPIFPIAAADRTGDARISSVAHEDGQTILGVINDGPPRTITWPSGETATLPTGSIRIASRGAAGVARISAGDPWPENDAVTLAAPVELASERWWIGASPPPDFRTFDAAALPSLEAWLSAQIVVLNNLPAAALDATAQQTLARYVRDLGGGLVIVGGSNAFSAGGYGGTDLDALSPLASNPPMPRREWLLLIDASGSMATRADDGRTRLEAVIDAARAAARNIPRSDGLAVASFARELQPWPARDDRQLNAPAGLAANGPTNLRAALEAIIASRGTSAALPLRVLALTDGDAELRDVSALAATLTAASVTIDWLALDVMEAAGPLADLVRSTGGSTFPAGTSARWPDAALAAVRAATDVRARNEPLPITWRGELASLGTMPAAQANTTYVRDGASVLAASTEDERVVAAAHWRVGAGRVAAVGFAAPAPTVEAVADLVESRPRDPRFRVSWDGERVTVEAATGDAALNGLMITVGEAGAASGVTLEQTAPGRYEGRVDVTGRGRIITTGVDGQTIDLHAAAALPAEEFQKIGVDRAALDALAARTGGSVIDRDQATPLPRIDAHRQRSLAVPLLLLGAASIAGALLPLPVRRERVGVRVRD